MEALLSKQIHGNSLDQAIEARNAKRYHGRIAWIGASEDAFAERKNREER
jgi:hypothetical protein